MNNTRKKCSKCQKTKPVSEFNKDKYTKSGYKCSCSACNAKYYIENKESMLAAQNKYRERNPNKNKDYYIKNRDRLRKDQKIYYENHKGEVNDRYKNRRKTDISYRLLCRFRTRISNVIRSQSGTKAYKSMELLGCTVEEARKHLESQFTEGMSWDTYGLKGWHIDHIRPCVSFDLTDPEQQKECFHYTNLHPLWAEDNLRKGDRY